MSAVIERNPRTPPEGMKTSTITRSRPNNNSSADQARGSMVMGRVRRVCGRTSNQLRRSRGGSLHIAGIGADQHAVALHADYNNLRATVNDFTIGNHVDELVSKACLARRGKLGSRLAPMAQQVLQINERFAMGKVFQLRV